LQDHYSVSNNFTERGDKSFWGVIKNGIKYQFPPKYHTCYTILYARYLYIGVFKNNNNAGGYI